MRIVRTEIFFNRHDLSWLALDRALAPEVDRRELNLDYQPNISVAWLRVEGAMIEDNLRDLYTSRPLDLNYRERDLRAFIGRTLSSHFVPGWEAALAEPDLVDFVLSADIIVERSPPTAEPFFALLSKAGKSAPVTLGGAVGYGLADGHASLLIVTVPLGVIIMGTAIGVSAGLQEGLHKRILKLLTSPRKR